MTSLPVIDPATEETITEFTDCGEEAVNEAVARAKASFESGVWSQLPGRERAKVLWKIADLIDEHAEEFAELDSLNTGMPLLQATLQMSTVFGVLPLLRRLVFQAQRRRLRREDRRHRDRRLRQHARLHAQRALRRCRPDLPVERPDLQRQRQARARTGRRRQPARQTR